MQAHYPRFVPAPNTAHPEREVKVLDAKDHQRRFPEDYARFQAELAADPTQGRATFISNVSAEEERERCALVAESLDKGKVGARIAAAIRGSAPLNGADPAPIVEPKAPVLSADPQPQTDFGKPLNAPVKSDEKKDK